MVRLNPTFASRDTRVLLDPLLELAEGCPQLVGSIVGTFAHEGRRYGIPRFLFVGPPAAHDPIRIGIFGGLHGDEPASASALVRLLCELAQDPTRAEGYDLVVYPLCNPTGFEDNTRFNRAGFDLNREFWRASAQPEVRILEDELRAHRFDGMITLHADDTSDGLYGYTHGRVLNEALLKPALAAAEHVIPRNRACTIDGFEAADGVLAQCFQGILAAPPEQKPQPFDLIFETPALLPCELQVRAAVAALGKILDEYRGFIAHAQFI